MARSSSFSSRSIFSFAFPIVKQNVDPLPGDCSTHIQLPLAFAHCLKGSSFALGCSQVNALTAECYFSMLLLCVVGSQRAQVSDAVFGSFDVISYCAR
jgi:hypothetical protein